jgi:hypothetical protein
VKEIAAFHIKSAAAKLPVGAQEKVKPEEPVFVLIETAPGNEEEIRHIFLVFHTPGLAVFLTVDYLLYADAGDMLLLLRQVPEFSVARSKNGTKHTTAGHFLPLPSIAQS